VILLREALDDKAWRQWTMLWHQWMGLSLWLLAVVRLAVRSQRPLAITHRAAPLWQELASATAHGLMYILLLVLPVLGWLLTNARGHPLDLPFVGMSGAWPEKSVDLAETLEIWHTTIAWTLAALVGMHGAAALWHHVVKRDGVLIAMLPWLGRGH
jgi:cytochrome b561